jgi:hypothetical protein
MLMAGFGMSSTPVFDSRICAALDANVVDDRSVHLFKGSGREKGVRRMFPK